MSRTFRPLLVFLTFLLAASSTTIAAAQQATPVIETPVSTAAPTTPVEAPAPTAAPATPEMVSADAMVGALAVGDGLVLVSRTYFVDRGANGTIDVGDTIVFNYVIRNDSTVDWSGGGLSLIETIPGLTWAYGPAFTIAAGPGAPQNNIMAYKLITADMLNNPDRVYCATIAVDGTPLSQTQAKFCRSLGFPRSTATMKLSLTSGRAGTAVTVTGTNYRPGELVTIHWGSEVGPTIGTVTATSSGTFSKTVIVPATAKVQAYYIHATAQSGQKANAKYTVTALAVVKVTLNKISGQAGTAVIMNGSGFQPGEVVTIRWGSAAGTPLGTVTAGSNGTFSKSVIVPATAKKQAYYIHATAPSGQKGFAKYTVTALAVVKVTLSTTAGKPGTAVTVNGSGFQPGEVVTIRWGSATGAPLGTVTATSNGTFSKSVVIPSSARLQAYYIHATAPSGQKGFAKYTVTNLAPAKIVLSKISGQAGTAVTVTGSNFRPGEVVTIRWGSATGPSLGTVTASSSGTFSKTVIVPATAKVLPYNIYANAPSGQQSYARYTVTSLAAAKVTLSRTSGQAGTAVTVSGSGFQPGEVVTVRWGSVTGSPIGTVRATADGKFSVSVKIPTYARKVVYYIYATAPSGQKSYSRYTVTMLAVLNDDTVTPTATETPLATSAIVTPTVTPIVSSDETSVATTPVETPDVTPVTPTTEPVGTTSDQTPTDTTTNVTSLPRTGNNGTGSSNAVSLVVGALLLSGLIAAALATVRGRRLP